MKNLGGDAVFVADFHSKIFLSHLDMTKNEKKSQKSLILFIFVVLLALL